MKQMKKFLALLLTVVMVLGLVPTAFANNAEGYSDVPTTFWGYEAITAWSNTGVLQGYGDGTFGPDNAMTLAELMTVLSKVFGYTERTAAEVTPEWADEYVEKAIAAGILEAAASVDATASVTREEAMYYIAIAYGMDPLDGNTRFADDADIDAEYKPYVNTMVNQGYIQGMGDGTFSPKTVLSRAQVMQVLYNINEATSGVLMAGAGADEIVFDQAMYPVEGFDGSVHLNPYARVLVVEEEARIAIVSLELVNVPADAITSIKEIVNELTGTPIENIWVHATHAITTPHAPSDAAARELYINAVLDAATVAAQEAADSFQEATVGVGTTDLDINANRDIQLSDGNWYYGLGSTMYSNKEMTMIRFDDLEGAPIGFLISYGIKPTAIDNSQMSAGTRSISSDVPGVACRMMEEEFGAPTMFCMSACGDQIPSVTALFYEMIGDKPTVIDLGVAAGISIVERLGAEMGNSAITLANSIICTSGNYTIHAADTDFTWANASGDGEVTVAVRAISIGDEIAFVGIKPEANAITGYQLSQASPYKYTMMMGFIDGDQKYMPDESAYDLKTWEFKRAGGAKGCAEQFVKVAVDLLKNIETMEALPDDGPDDGDTELETVTFAGKEWYVLDENNGQQLLLSKYVLEMKAYDADGGATTWETSDLRAYLNGEFLTTAFTAEEQAKIVSTTLENKSNAYGISGGNATTDKVFLLSISDVEQYFTGVEYLRGILTGTSETVWWHLRSPGEATDVNSGVNTIGLLDTHGVDGGVTTVGGVRPAIWVTDLG